MSSLHLVTDPPDASQPDLSCSFCNKPRADVGWLVTGPERRAICDECITLAAEVIATRRGDPPPVPPDLDAVLARELVGQDAAARSRQGGDGPVHPAHKLVAGCSGGGG